jgi:hypothetical protein
MAQRFRTKQDEVLRLVHRAGILRPRDLDAYLMIPELFDEDEDVLPAC